MFGFVVGAVAGVLLLRVYQRGGFGRFGFARGCGGRGFGRHGHHGGPGGWRGRWMTRWLFQRLGTSPGQEKVILEAVDDVTAEGDKLRDEFRKGRSDLARAVRGPTFDEGAVKEAQARQDDLLKSLREKLSTQLAQVFEALDERQRRELAEVIEYGLGRGGRQRWDM
jgi:uncharacterized membrane protein